MRVSFDIDSTLVPYASEFEVEKCNSLLNLGSKEHLRVGSKQLLKELLRQKHEVWIYTTSFRPIWKLKILFGKYGIFPNGFINEKLNLKKQSRQDVKASKNPKLFNIDLHIDDSEGVKLEGEKLGFETLIISPDDHAWVNTVMVKISEMENKI